MSPADHLPGQDAFGHFALEGNRCMVCARIGICVRYGPDAKLPNGIDEMSTIVGKLRNPIGVTCGCYGKFHRQVAHIADNINIKV